MVVTVKNISEIFGKDVFTNRGVFCGRVADVEVNLARFRINALVVQTGKGSFLADMVGGKKGVVVPYQLVTSVGDVVIIKHITPTMPESAPEDFESTEV